MALEAVPILAARAAAVHAFGANVLAIKKDAKRPAHSWKRWQTQRQIEADVASLPWRSADRVGIVNGLNGLRSFDIDGCEAGRAGLRVIWQVLGALGLTDAYPWVEQSASGRGWHVWVVCDEPMPAGALPAKKKEEGDEEEHGIFWGESRDGSFDHIELRWERNQTIIASSDGNNRWLNDEPVEPPARVGIAAILAAFSAVAHIPEDEAVPEAHPTPSASPTTTPSRAASVPGDVRDAKVEIKHRFDMVGYARQRFGSEVQKEPGGEVRILGNGGLLLKPDDGVWYRFSGEVGGDCFDLVGLDLFGPAWDRRDKGMFAQVLRRAGEYAGVQTEAVRVHGLRVVHGADEVRDGAGDGADMVRDDDRTEAESPWRRFLSKRADVWNAIVNGIEPPQFLVSPIVLDAKVTVIFGGPEQGKTWILLHSILCVLREGRKVLLLDEESGLRDTAERLEALGMTEDDNRFLYYFPFAAEGTLDAMADAVLDGLMQERFALIACDSISKLFAAAGLDENSNSDATKLMRAWITPASHIFGCAFLGLDHTTKIEDDSRYGRGAGSKLADVDVQWHIEAKVPPSRTSLGRLVLSNKKDRTASVPKTVRYIAGGDGAGMVRIALEGTSDVIVPAIRDKDRAAVIALFGGLNAGMRLTDWQEATVIPKRTLIDMAHRLTEQKIIGRSGDLYYVTSQGAGWCGLGAGTNPHLTASEQNRGGDGADSSPHPFRGGESAPSTPMLPHQAKNDMSATDEDEEWIDGKPPF